MKLVLNKREWQNGCLKVSWPSNDPDVSWISLWYAATSEERRIGWTEDTTHLTTIFSEFSKIAIRPSDHAYAVIATPFSEEYEGWIEGLRKSGQTFLTIYDLKSRVGLLNRILYPKGDIKTLYVARVTPENVAFWYSRRGGAREYVCHLFLISDHPIDDWVGALMKLQKKRLDKDFLARFGRVMLNHWEHGIELIGLHIDPEPFVAVAQRLSGRLGSSLEVEEEWTDTHRLRRFRSPRTKRKITQ